MHGFFWVNPQSGTDIQFSKDQFMSFHFADRIKRAPKSFLSELFSVSNNPSIISFAGGLPSSALIDTEGIAQATRQVMEEDAHVALQYTTTDGYLPLREYIADRYRTRSGIAGDRFRDPDRQRLAAVP